MLRLYSIDCIVLIMSLILFLLIGGFTYFTLSAKEKLQAHRHVLTNCTIVDPLVSVCTIVIFFIIDFPFNI